MRVVRVMRELLWLLLLSIRRASGVYNPNDEWVPRSGSSNKAGARVAVGGGGGAAAIAAVGRDAQVFGRHGLRADTVKQRNGGSMVDAH